MPDPVSNAEVEDVLASIRRLVSEDKRAAAPRPEPARAEPGKLVLTPALRVAEPEMEAPEASAEPQAQAEEVPGVTDEGAGTPAAAEAQTSGQREEPAEIASFDQDKLAAEHARLAAELVRGRFGLTGNTDAATVQSAAPPVAETLEEATQDSSDAVAHAAAHSEAEPEPVAASAEPDPATPAPAPEAKRAGDGEDRQSPGSLGAKIAALEAAVARRQDEWEPDGVAEAEPYSGTVPRTLAWDDVTDPVLDEDAPAGWPQTVTAPSWGEQGSAEDPADLLQEPALLDEEALRDMVAEIVREELQGALGERITRNVRKLVRREIQRALAAHDLD